MTLQELYSKSQLSAKKQFRDMLDTEISSSISIKGNYADLSYDKPNDYKKISRLLLLFNVISVMKHGESSQWFPFDKFKYTEKNKVAWSLEHIHAQQSEKLRTEELWREWLRMHRSSIAVIDENSTLPAEIDELLGKSKIEKKDFDDLQERIFEQLSAQGSTEYMHSISNLALLNTRDNAALTIRLLMSNRMKLSKWIKKVNTYLSAPEWSF